MKEFIVMSSKTYNSSDEKLNNYQQTYQNLDILETPMAFYLDLSHLTLESTLAHLPTHDFQISPDAPGYVVANEFERQPDLPGVIIVERSRVLGVFSRRKFLEKIGRPYGVEVYLKRPVRLLLEAIEPHFLILPGDCAIDVAAQIALDRPPELAYEPMIIKFPPSQNPNSSTKYQLRLLNVYLLLLAQTRLLNIANKTIEARAKELEEIIAVKDKFFSIISHDLRAPFSPLLGMCEVLPLMIDQQSSMSDIKQATESIHRSARNVYNLLENLLEWASIQRGQIPLEPTEINLSQLIQGTLSLLADKALEKKLTLTTKMPAEVWVYADENLLDTVLRNLTSNALKFTPSGGQVTIAAYPKANFVEVTVSDTGVGMPADVQANLFQPGKNRSTLGTAKEQGTGLGLVLCKEMVEKNRGNIWVESVIDQGTTFYFTIPMAQRASETTAYDPVEQVMVATSESAPPSSEEFHIPSPEIMHHLLELARIGDLASIEEQANQLMETNDQLTSFARKLQILVSQFAEEELLAFISQHLKQ